MSVDATSVSRGSMRDAARDLRGCLRLASLLAPLTIAVVVGYLSCAGLYAPPKYVLEELAIWLLGVACGIAVFRFVFQRQLFFLWGTALLSSFLYREIHLVGSSNGVYIGMVLLLFLALRFHASLGDYLATRRVVNLLAMGCSSYFISVTIDSRWWKARGGWPGIPGEETFHVPLEETMEVVGHVFASLAILLARRRTSPVD